MTRRAAILLASCVLAAYAVAAASYGWPWWLSLEVRAQGESVGRDAEHVVEADPDTEQGREALTVAIREFLA